MQRLILIIVLSAAFNPQASAEPARSASWRYFTDFQGSPIKATQYMEYVGGNFDTCHSLLALAQGLNPKFQAVFNNCGIDLPPPPGSLQNVDPPPPEFYISYEEPALRSRVLKTFTVYHISPQQIAARDICQQLIAAFHSTQINPKCHAPKAK